MPVLEAPPGLEGGSDAPNERLKGEREKVSEETSPQKLKGVAAKPKSLRISEAVRFSPTRGNPQKKEGKEGR